MIKKLVRRSSLALLLAIPTVASVGTAHAGITGTDPCPRGMPCAAPPTSNAVLSTTSLAAQLALVLFGLA